MKRRNLRVVRRVEAAHEWYALHETDDEARLNSLTVDPITLCAHSVAE